MDCAGGASHDVAVDVLAQVEGGEQEEAGEGPAGAGDRRPGGAVAPGGVGGDQRLAPGPRRSVQPAQLAAGVHHQAAAAGDRIVEAAGGDGQRAGLRNWSGCRWRGRRRRHRGGSPRPSQPPIAVTTFGHVVDNSVSCTDRRSISKIGARKVKATNTTRGTTSASAPKRRPRSARACCRRSVPTSKTAAGSA